MQRTCPCHAAGSSLLPEVGVSPGKLQNPLSCWRRCPQHNTKNTTQRERSRTAVRTLQVYLTWFRSEDSFWGDRSPGTSRWKLCPWGTAPVVHLSSGIATRPRSGQGVQKFHKQLLCTPQAVLEPVSPLVLTKGWRTLAEAGITLPKLPVLQQQKGSQSCSSSGLSQDSPAF